MIAQQFVRSVEVPADLEVDPAAHPWTVPAVRALRDRPLSLHPSVTYLVGDNGSGKSTVLEAIAEAAGMNPEGGTSNLRFETRASHSALGGALRLVRGTRRPRTDFFLRAESLYNAATRLDDLATEDPRTLNAYGGRSLHALSHGESFMAILLHRFGPEGLYLLDEPESALSSTGCLAFLRRVHDLCRQGSQFIVATHSPLVLAYPDAQIHRCDEHGITEVDYDDVEAVSTTRAVLTDRHRMLDRLLD